MRGAWQGSVASVRGRNTARGRRPAMPMGSPSPSGGGGGDVVLGLAEVQRVDERLHEQDRRRRPRRSLDRRRGAAQPPSLTPRPVSRRFTAGARVVACGGPVETIGRSRPATPGGASDGGSRGWPAGLGVGGGGEAR